MKRKKIATPAIPLPDPGPWQLIVLNDTLYALSAETGLYRLNKVTNRLDPVALI